MCSSDLAFATPVGALVDEGALIAEIIDPASGAVTPVRAGTSGILFARTRGRMAEAGMRIGKIAGRRPLRTGDLLSP